MKKTSIKDSFQPCWKGPYQVLLTNLYAAKLKGVNSSIHISHRKQKKSA